MFLKVEDVLPSAVMGSVTLKVPNIRVITGRKAGSLYKLLNCSCCDCTIQQIHAGHKVLTPKCALSVAWRCTVYTCSVCTSTYGFVTLW